MRRHLANEQETAALAADFWSVLANTLAGWTVLLQGDLGAGKSTFARAFIRAAGHDGAIPSPTYTLIEPYSVSAGRIYHVDLYRIASPDELHYLGWDELFDGCRLIEWSERIPGVAEGADIEVRLSLAGPGRDAELLALSPRGAAALEAMGPNNSAD